MVGDRVYLRPLEASDAPLLALGRHQETETFFDVGRVPYSEIAYEQWIERLCAEQPPEEIQLAICLKDGDDLIGMTGAGNLDWINRTGETEIYISSPAHRERGFGTEAKHLLLEYLFDRLQLEVVSSFILEMNERSASSVLRQGYRRAGRIKTLLVHQGRFHDVLVFDLLREDWVEAREQWRARRSS
jgi:RimJ/RimL family protein N-acetyltransferase